jgi:phosphate starvation-inducible protein PhoH
VAVLNVDLETLVADADDTLERLTGDGTLIVCGAPSQLDLPRPD